MMEVGIEIFYSLQGAGFIRGVETLRLVDPPQEYYKVHINSSSMTLYIPTSNAEEMGLRPLSSLGQLEEARKMFFLEPVELPENSTERKILLKKRMKSGKIKDLYQITRDITSSKWHRVKLNADDKHTLAHSIALLESELMGIKKITLEKARLWMKEDIAECELALAQ